MGGTGTTAPTGDDPVAPASGPFLDTNDFAK